MMYCVLLGIGEQYFPRFVLELGMGEVAAGLVATVPVFIAAIMQLAAPRLVHLAGSYRRVFSFCGWWQAAMFIPLALIAAASHLWMPWHQRLEAACRAESRGLGDVVGFIPEVVLFSVVTFSVAGAVVGGPAWTAHVGEMIPRRVRPRYLGHRNLLLGAALLAGLLAGAGLLRLSTSFAGHGEILGMPPAMAAFTAMFLIAAVARAISAYYLSTYSTPKKGLAMPVTVPARALAGRLIRASEGRVLGVLLCMQAAHLIAFPYFNPFMKERLMLGDTPYGLLLGAFFLGKLIAPAPAGRLIHRFGVARVLWLACAAMVPVPLFWLVSDALVWLLIAQVLSGAALSVFELCSFMAQLDHVKTEERASVLSKFGLLFHASGMLGSIGGGWVLNATGRSFGGYESVFAISALARLGSLALLTRLNRPGRGPDPGVPAFEPPGSEDVVALPPAGEEFASKRGDRRRSE